MARLVPSQWKSGCLNRVARSSLSAETQALADLDGDLMYARLTWAEMNGHRGELKEKDQWIRSVPATMVIDARALMTRWKGMKDKFSALETLALSQSMVTLGTQLQWTDSDHQLADGLTKIQKQDTLKRFLASGCWRLRHPGAFMSAKKRRALEALGPCFARERIAKAVIFRQPSLGHVREAVSNTFDLSLPSALCFSMSYMCPPQACLWLKPCATSLKKLLKKLRRLSHRPAVRCRTTRDRSRRLRKRTAQPV